MTPGISVAGNFVDFNSGWVDALVPVVRTTPSSFLYLDPQGLYHNNDQYSASIGGGFRILTQNAGILGAYVFGDYNHSQQNNSYWFVSPGLERLGDTLDFSVNGYFPISSQRNNTTSGFASQFGDTDDIVFSGHNEIDTIVQNFESTGVGVDGEIGYRLPFLRNNTKLYLGGYYFSPKDNNSITGGIAKLEVPVNHLLSLTVSDAFDNIFHNTFRAGASLSLWGRSTHFYNHGIETRMVDPVQRNRIAQEGHSGTDQYITEGQENMGTGILLSNIWFFAPGGTPGPLLTDTSATPTAVSLNQCTAEHPCAAVDVNTNFFGGINLIAPNAKMFLAPGIYSNLGWSKRYWQRYAAPQRWSIEYGRTADYKSLGVGDNRAELVGSVDLFGNTILNSLRLQNNNSQQTQAVVVEDNAQSVSLYNVLIGNIGSNPAQSYLIGMQIGNHSAVSISSSEIDAFTNVTPNTAVGINTIGSGNHITISDSVLNTQGISSLVTTAENIADSGSQNVWALSNNQLFAQDSSTVLTSSAYNILTVGSSLSAWTLTNNQLTAIVEGDDGAAINILSQTSSSTGWMLSGNQMTATVIGDEGSTAIAIKERVSNDDSWIITNNFIAATGSGAGSKAYGFFLNSDDTNWILKNNKIVVSATGDDPVAIAIGLSFFLEGNNNAWLLENNQIKVSASGDSAEAIGITPQDVNDAWILISNAVTISAAGNNSIASGISNLFASNIWQLNHNQFAVNSTGTNSNAIGFSIQGNQDNITSQNDSWSIQASGSGANGYGFASDAGGFSSGINNTINLTGDLIIVNADNTAYGIYDGDPLRAIRR